MNVPPESQHYSLEQLNEEMQEHIPSFDPAYFIEETNDFETSVEIETPPASPPPPSPPTRPARVAEPRRVLRGRTIWTAEGAEDFAGEFSERIVEAIVPPRRSATKKKAVAPPSTSPPPHEEASLVTQVLGSELPEEFTLHHVEASHFDWQEIIDEYVVDPAARNGAVPPSHISQAQRRSTEDYDAERRYGHAVEIDDEEEAEAA